MKLLHTADWHVRDKDILECEKCLNLVVETAREEKVRQIIIAGDIFDSRDIKLDSLSAKLAIKIISELVDICPVAIITGTPSHDGTAPEILSYVKGKYPLYVATKPIQVPLCGEGIEIDLTLIPTPTKQFFNSNNDIQTSNEDISSAMNAVFAGFGAQAEEHDCPHILVGHWNVSGAKLSTGQTLTGQDIDISIDQMMFANPDLICLGHIHMSQQLGDRTFYSGSLYPLTWGELEKKGFWIHEIKKNAGKKGCPYKTTSQFIETPTKKLLRSEADFTIGDIRELDVVLYEYSPEELTGAFIRLDLTVWQDEAVKIDKEKIRGFYISGGAIDADIRIIRVPRQVVRSESVLKAESLRDKLVAMAAIKEETVPGNILIKADGLESGPAEEVIKRAT